MLDNSAFDPGLSLNSRELEFPFFEPIRAEDGLKRFFEDVRTRAGIDADGVRVLREALFDVFTRAALGTDDSGRLLVPDGLVLAIAIDDTWTQCLLCGHVQLKPYLGSCANCGRKELEPRPPEHPYMTARKGFFREPLRAVLRGQRPIHLTAEEHTAQLSQRDAGVVYATTEEFRTTLSGCAARSEETPSGHFKLHNNDGGWNRHRVVDRSGASHRTTAAEKTYQQRAGRAGRRGASVSSVLTFAQGGAHDAHYFANPEAMISGAPREPRIKSDNKRLARRHIYSYLLQTFFHMQPLLSKTKFEERG